MLVLVEFLSDSRLLGFLPIVRACTICLDLVARNKDRCDILRCYSSVIGENEVVRLCLGGIEMARPVKLYNHAVAPNPRRVRIFAAEKGIALSLEEVDILAGQSRTPEFLAKNSSGGVPVLELDDGSYLSESVAICRYLEGLHPEPNLLGRDLREQAEIERWNRRMELELFAAIGRTFQNTSFAGERFTIADITALVAIDIGGRLADIKIAPELAYLTRWHELVSSRPSAKA